MQIENEQMGGLMRLMEVAPEAARRSLELKARQLHGVFADGVEFAKPEDKAAAIAAAGEYLHAYARAACDFGALSTQEYAAVVDTLMAALEQPEPQLAPTHDVFGY